MLRSLPFLLVTMLLLLVSTACDELIGPLTPPEAYRQFHVRDAPESAATFQVVATRQWERGAVVLYTYVRPAQGQTPPLQIFGYDLVEDRGGGSWRITGGGEGGRPGPPPAKELISYSSGSGWNRVRGDFSIVYGRTLAPQVAFVEATFDNGQVLRDGTGDGFFVLITPVSTTPCELRALDAEGQVLRRIDAAARAAPAKEFSMPEDNCQAASAQ
jgi:hypothetical protein